MKYVTPVKNKYKFHCYFLSTFDGMKRDGTLAFRTMVFNGPRLTQRRLNILRERIGQPDGEPFSIISIAEI